MGTMSAGVATFTLKASGVPAGTNVEGSMRLGVTQTDKSFPDADICYSFRVEANDDGNSVELDIPTGVVTAVVGSPTIIDGDGKDFEGATLPALVTGYAILAHRDPNQTNGYIDVVASGAAEEAFNVRIHERANLIPLVTSLPSSGIITITFQTDNDWIEVTILGKSS